MSKFNELLSFKSSCGRQFELLEGEKLAIDGVDFTDQTGGRASYVLFVTNKRLILKQGNISWNGRGADSAFLADVRYVMLEDVKSIAVHGSGFGGYAFIVDAVFKDFSVKEKTGDSEYILGSASKGFGGMEYSSERELYEGLTRTFKGLSDEYGFGVYFTGKNSEMSTLSKEEGLKRAREWKKQRLQIIVFLLVIISGFFGWMYYFGDTPRNRQLQEERAVAETPQLDPNTIVKPIRDPSGRFDYVVPTQQYTEVCYTTAYSGSNGTESKEFGCNIQYNTNSIDVEWSDGIRTTFNFDPYGFTIVTNGTVDAAKMEVVTWEGKRYYLFESFKGSSTWIPQA